MKKILADRVLLFLFLGSFLAGSLVFDDYGLAWDEPAMRSIGYVNYDYVRGKPGAEKTFDQLFEKNYGAGVELPLIVVERILNLEKPAGIFLMRHFITHLFFILGAICIYLWMKLVFKSRFWAAVGFLVWILHPVLYAHSFFNSKDLPFMCIWALSLYLITLAFQKNRTGLFIAAGAAMGYLMNIRIMGILLVLCAVALLALDFFFNRPERKKTLLRILLVTATAYLVLFITWPYLWKRPFYNFYEAFSGMSQYAWNNPVHFMGETVLAPDLPWYFAPVSFAITTPLLWVICGITGLLLLMGNFFRKPLQYLHNTPDRAVLLAAVAGIGPLLAIVIFDSVVYDSWRHLFFIWPGFLFLAIYAMRQIHLAFSAKKVIIIAGSALLALQFLEIAWFTVRVHPNEQIYFNQLVPKKDDYIRRNFEFDYWAVSLREGVEYILANDDRAEITVSCWQTPIHNTDYYLSPEQASRIKVIDDFWQANYFLSTYRQHPTDFTELGEPWKKFEILGSQYLAIWKIK